MSEGEKRLNHERYVRSNGYDPEWVIANLMGPHPLWLMEALAEKMAIAPGMRVLDLGCGTALTSVFVAKEFGAEVWATDLWIDASENADRVREAGVEDRVTTVHAEAHSLPFDEGFFDAIVSVDAYQYFGTDDLYIGYVTRFLRSGGQIGIVVPAVFEELATEVPEELRPYWDWEFCCFHGPKWWRAHWEKTARVSVVSADAVPDGWSDWLRFSEESMPSLDGWRLEAARNEQAMLRVDRGRRLGFTRVVATKESSP